MRKTKGQTEKSWNYQADDKRDRAATQSESADRQEEQRDQFDRNRGAQRDRAENRIAPLAARLCGRILLRDETEDAGEHRQDHQTVEMRRAGETVNDERIPGIPGGVGVAHATADQSQENRDRHRDRQRRRAICRASGLADEAAERQRKSAPCPADKSR